MNTTKTIVAAAVLMVSAMAAHATEYSFVVENHSKQKITGIQASEDGKTWGAFNVGKGVDAGGQSKMVWDPSTDSTGCTWQVKATYADGSESEAAPFDFCEKDLVLEFEE